MISAAQASQYIDATLGVGLPAFLVSAAVESVEALEPAMLAAGYDEPTIVRIQALTVAIVAAAGNPRRVTAQGAPSGASRSFKYADGDLSALRRSLRALDTAQTTAALVGPDPTSATLLMVV